MQKRYALFVDDRSCWGCRTCEVACKQENRAPDGIQYILVAEEGPGMVEGKPDFVYRVNRCHHCDNPRCAEACPVEAITRRGDGLVVLDDGSCTGCALCVDACPYSAIGFDEQKGRARKCNLCHHRVDRGLIPACADNVCPAHCILFAEADQGERMMADKILLKERLAKDEAGR